MLSKEQAAAAADALVDEASGNRVRRAPFIPFLLRCRALETVEPSQRLALIQQAQLNVRRSAAYRTAVGIWILFVLFVLLGLTLPELRRALPGFQSAAARMGLPVSLVMLSGTWILIRREIARLAKVGA